MTKLAQPKEITKFWTPKFLTIAPPGIIYGAEVVSGVYDTAGPKKKDPNNPNATIQPTRHAIKVRYTPQGQPTTVYEFGLTDENYKALFNVLGDDDAKWMGATFDSQATKYPNLSTEGFVVIANSIKPKTK